MRRDGEKCSLDIVSDCDCAKERNAETNCKVELGIIPGISEDTLSADAVLTSEKVEDWDEY